MTALADLVPTLQRELAVPGTFSTAFPSTTTGGLEATLADAFAQAQLDGFFSTMALNTTTNVVTPDLSAAGGALVGIYAAVRVIRAQVRAVALAGAVRYKAGPVELERAPLSAVLRDELAELKSRKDALVDQATSSSEVFVLDAYVTGVALSARGGYLEYYGLGAFYPYELS